MASQEQQQLCAICADDECDHQWHTLECGHSFHTPCILKWFREAGTCPLCRDQTDTIMDELDVRDRADMMMNMVREQKRPVPRDVRSLTTKVAKSEEKAKKRRRDEREFYRENKAVIRKWRKLQRLRVNAETKANRRVRQLGMYHSAEFPVPLCCVRRVSAGTLFSGQRISIGWDDDDMPTEIIDEPLQI